MLCEIKKCIVSKDFYSIVIAISLNAFDRTYTIHVVFQSCEFYDVARVLIADARPFQA